jgi:hypothetical protein
MLQCNKFHRKIEERSGGCMWTGNIGITRFQNLAVTVRRTVRGAPGEILLLPSAEAQ